MAYDKVVDSAVLDAGLKQIADEIREKGGTSDTLAFPTAMAEAIAAIQAGGGGGITYAKGTITPAENITGPFSIEHNLGENPSMLVFWRKSHSTFKQKNEIINAVDSKESGSQLVTFVDSSGFWIASDNSSGLTGAYSSSSYVNYANSKDLELGKSSSTLFAGNTYIWYAFLGVK